MSVLLIPIILDMLIATNDTSAGYHGVTEDSYTAAPNIRNMHGNVVYNATEGFGYSVRNGQI